MRAPVRFRRPPTAWERLLGRRNTRLLRRRAGLVAVGVGLSLLAPARRRAQLTVVATAVLALVVVLVLR